MLKQRLITAIVLVPIFVALLLWLSPKAFGILTTLFILIAAWEWSGFMGVKSKLLSLCYPVLIFVFLPISLVMPIMAILIGALLWWITAFILVLRYPNAATVWGNGIFWRAIMGILVLVPAWRAINFIRDADIQSGPYLLLFLFILIWGADSGAYFVGKKWGKTKLAPLVSPGKTWQGLYGALFTTLFLMLVALCFFQPSFSIWPLALILAVITVLFSVLGDLVESMLKRNVGLKDSGRLFPGHGGLLDRIDSLTAAAPVFALGGILMSKIFH